MEKRIIITGATSFIGSHLAKAAIQKGYKVFCVVRPDSKHFGTLGEIKEHLEFVYCDLKEYDSLASKLDVRGFESFVHLAWNGTRGEDRLNEDLQKSNYLHSLEAYRSAIELGCKSFLSVGSQAEYGPNASKELVTEETRENPNTAYGFYKCKTIHEILALEEKEPRIDVKWLRLFSGYGVGDWEKSMVMNATINMLQNRPIAFTKGIQLWNFLNVRDLVSIMLKLIDVRGNNGIFNASSDDTRPLRSFIEEIKVLTNSSSQIDFGAVPYGPAGIINLNPSNEKLKSLIGYNEFVSFADGINEIIESIK